MRIVPNNVPAGDSSGGYIGAPQSREWLKEWIEDKGRWVLLECGHIDDIGDRSITLIKKFDGTLVGCEECNRFVPIKKTLRHKNPPAKIPDEPLY